VSGNALGDFLPQNSSGHPVDRDLSDSWISREIDRVNFFGLQ
jgi:hypothetical protein